MSEFNTINLEKITEQNNNFSNSFVNNPIKKTQSTHTGGFAYDSESFDKSYEDGLKLIGGDKLLKPAASNAIIRKTTTQGVYKVLINKGGSTEIKILDESQLFNNKKFAAGSISKIGQDEYEIITFDEEENMEINHFDKNDAIKYLAESDLILEIF